MGAVGNRKNREGVCGEWVLGTVGTKGCGVGGMVLLGWLAARSSM